MSIAKKSALMLSALAVVFLSACAGSKGGSGSTESGEQSFNADGTPAEPKEEISEDKLKKTHEEAMAITEENHDLRRQIFEAKNKLGIPVEQEEESSDASKK